MILIDSLRRRMADADGAKNVSTPISRLQKSVPADRLQSAERITSPIIKLQQAKYLFSKYRAGNAGHTFTITLEEWLDLYPNPGDRCRICLLEMVNGGRTTPSADRHDNNLGYESGNVQFICAECNTRKRDMGPELLHRLGLYAAGMLGPVGPEPNKGLTTEPASATL